MGLAMESVVAAGVASLAVGAAGFAFTRSTHQHPDERGHYLFLDHLPPISDTTKSFAGRVMDDESPDEPRKIASWERLADTVGWVHEAGARIRYLAEKPDGWKGAESHGASEEARKDAFAFLDKLQAEAPMAAPMISLDEEGEFVLYWKSDGLLASVSISGDRTFTFFGNIGHGDIIREAVDLSSPLPPEVVEVLSARV